MTSFSKPTGPFTNDELRAYVETMMLFAIADGTVRKTELNMVQMTVVGYLENHPALKAMTRQQLMDLCFDCANAIYDEGPSVRLNKVAGILTTEQQRMFALSMAAAVASADGYIQTGERAGFALLQRAFGLTAEQVRAAIEAFD
ncbi:MAG: tellurite resistance TerB family protein [Chloroflexi bacterium]|nr:tellurite resistance TerB family protein [Chloroflexota bacterium]